VLRPLPHWRKALPLWWKALPLWRKAPASLLHDPPLFGGCLAAALLVALAAASAPLFTTAAGSAAFRSRLTQIAPLGAGIHVVRPGVAEERSPSAILRDHARRGRLVSRAVGPSPRLGPIVDTLLTDPILVATDRTAYVRLVSRTGALQHVHRLAGGGAGIWIADNVASRLNVGPGDALRVGVPAGTRARVGGVYRALWKEVSNDDWVNFSAEIYPRGVDPSAPPTFALLSPSELLRLYLPLGNPYLVEQWEIPLRGHGMTLEQARALEPRFAAVEAALRDPHSRLSRALGCEPKVPFGSTLCSASSSLGSAIGLADRSADAVSAPARLLGGVGLVIALGIAAVVGAFLVTRRRAEARHLFARGESPAAYGARTALEALPATLLGGAAGFGLALLLVRVFQPGGALDPASVRQAIVAAAVAVAVALALLVGSATAGFLRQFDTAPRGLRRLGLVPWELVAGGVGLYLFFDVRSGGGLTGATATSAGHPRLYVFLLPLLLVAAATGLVLRALRALLRRVDPDRVPVYLAVRRAAIGSGMLAALTIVVAVALGVLVYGGALSASLAHGARQKAAIAVGGDVQGPVDQDSTIPRLPFPATKVVVGYGGASVGSVTGDQVDVMEVDPATLAPVLRWDGSWGPPPARTMPELARLGADGRLPVLVTRGFPDTGAVWLAGSRVPIRIVARVRAFPGMSTDAPLVVASAKLLRRTVASGAYDPIENGLALVWARGPIAQVEAALKASPLRPDYFVTVDDVVGSREVTDAARTYSFLTALGLAIGALALVGVVLYLYARQRSQVIASALAGRMGLERREETASLWLELAAILTVAWALATGVGLAAAGPVIARTDPIPTYPPAPSFVVPWVVVGATFGCLLAVALAAAVAATALARRSEVAEELRLV
jgi:putative ABC transport system permease protein